MTRRLFSAIWVAGLAGALAARAVPPAAPQPGPPTPEELAAGQALAEHLRSSVPEENSEFKGKLIIKANGTTTEIPITCSVRVHAANWETDYATGAPGHEEHYVVIHQTNGPGQYLSGPTAATLAPVEDTTLPVAGSDFSLGDLGLEFLHWPAQRQLKGEMRLGQPCYVLESSNPRAKEIVRVRSDIDKESGGLLIAEGFDAKGDMVKKFSLGGNSFKKVHGRWQVEKMDIYNKKTGSQTELKFDLNK